MGPLRDSSAAVLKLKKKGKKEGKYHPPASSGQ
jgi:hypothetical protein